MFDKVTKKLAEKMGRGVQAAAEPIRTGVKEAANNKVDLWSKILRLGVLVFLFVDGTRRVVSEPKASETPPQQIVINNYVDTKPVRRGSCQKNRPLDKERR